VKFHEGRYEVGLPWLREKDEVPEHYNVCFNRLKHLQRRLIKDANLLKEYQSLISEQSKLGIIELTDDVEKPNKSYVHYLTHHPIIKHDRSTTKVQIVYDGSTLTSDDVSLNDCLQVGPKMIPKLFNVLIQFRCHQITLVADIEKAFLMVSIAEG